MLPTVACDPRLPPMQRRSAASGRELGGIETAMAIGNAMSPLNMVTVLRLGAQPDAALLRRTFDVLQRRHPPLRARIERRRRRRRFVQGTPPIPLRVVEGADDQQWMTEVESLLNTAMPAAGPLVAATLVQHAAGERSELIVGYQHTIVDGVAAATLWGELLATYAELDDGGAPDPSPAPVPPAADGLLPARARGRSLLSARLRFAARSLVDEARFRRSTRRWAPGVDRSSRTIVETRTFDEATSRGIARAARTNHCTVHSLLHAVVLRTVHRARYGGEEAWLRTIAFADLRPHLDPSPSPAALAPYVALTAQDVRLTRDRSLWDAVHAVQHELRASVKGDAKFVRYHIAAPLMRMATGVARLRMATSAVSHTGPVPIAGADGRLPVEGLHAFVSNLAIGPELSLRTGSFRGRLTLDMMALDTDMRRADLAGLADQLVEELDGVAATADC